MINVKRSLGMLKRLVETEGHRYEEYGSNAVIVYTKKNTFEIKVFFSHIDIYPFEPVEREDYWLYHAWVVID